MLIVLKINVFVTQLEHFRLLFRQEFSFVLSIPKSNYDYSVDWRLPLNC